MDTYLKRKFKMCGFYVLVYDFGYASFYYPEFNGNAEFPVSQKGFRQLSSYLRTVNYLHHIVFQLP